MASRNQKTLKGIEKTLAEKANRIEEIWAIEDKEDRPLEEHEREEVHELTKALRELKSQKKEVEANIALEQEVKEASKGGADPEPIQIDPKVAVINEPPKSLGEQFTSSKAYQQFFGAGGKAPSGDWKMDAVELETKATMSSGGTLSGAGPYQQYVPGIIEVPAQAPTVASLLPSQVATAPQIQFFKERIATNNAAGVAEAAGKPESVIDFQADSNSLAKIATYLPVSDEITSSSLVIWLYAGRSEHPTLRVTLYGGRENASGADNQQERLADGENPQRLIRQTPRGGGIWAKIESELHGDMQSLSGDALALS